jgi:polyvinyl alcohol dehydrogenase (cytochrome)
MDFKRVVSSVVVALGIPCAAVAQPSSTPPAGQCAGPRAFTLSDTPMWNGWGVDASNSRFQPARAAGLTAETVPKLRLKWAFGFAGGTAAYGQPTIAGGRVFVGSDNGFVYSLDAASGCTYWAHEVTAGVRTAISIGASTAAPSGYLAYFGDIRGLVHAVDAASGAAVWTHKVDDHPSARVTGAPTLAGDRLVVAVSSLEEGPGAAVTYSCCTFRGSVLAIDAHTGTRLWKTYTIDEEPKPTKKNAKGLQLYGPSGVAIWSAPTVDLARGTVYAATGNSYSEPAADTNDSVLAFDLASGKLLWKKPITPNDVFVVGCGPKNQSGNCAGDVGPDFDFGNSPILRTLPGGRRILVLGQKSGVAYGLDPDKQGEIIWQTRVGKGTALGGVEWGSAADDQYMYVANSDVLLPAADQGGLFALRLATGERVWATPSPDVKCPVGRGCNKAQSAAISVIPGVVFSGAMNGYMRGYSTTDGRIIWEFNTWQEFTTVNGVPARGGAINAPGPTIAGGMLLTNSGYGMFGGAPGNVLLAFGVD